jgi:prepilin-type N-terminal cleavage/methylation domain-containing protein
MNSATFPSDVQDLLGRDINGTKNVHFHRTPLCSFGRRASGGNFNFLRRRKNHRDDGFTLVELLITLTILPLVIGALSLGLIAVFSLNGQTSSRLTDTADAQVVASTYQKDVQSAGYITNDSNSSPQCGAGVLAGSTQLLALESVPNQKTGDFQTVISYVAVPVTSGATTTYSLVRLYCTNGSVAPASETTLAFDLPSPTSATAPLTPPTIFCSSGASPSVCSGANQECQQCTQGYVPAQDIGTVSFSVTEPASTYNYVLAASPAASTSFNSGGVASTPAATCESTIGLAGGPYAGQICFIDFSGLTQNDLAVAETPGQCYNMSVAIGPTDILHFCLGISSNNANEGAVPTALPSDTNAGLGNTVYPGVAGEPALYMNPYISEATTMTFSLSAFNLVNASTGQAVTNWTFLSADAETTNSQESISWTSNVPISVVNDAEAGASNPDGNACPMSGGGSTTVTCTGNLNSENSPLTGAAMVSVSGNSLSSFTVNTNNYQAIAFGMFL